MSITRENFIWHKLHSLTGIIPVGFYMIQHLVLNSFSLAGESRFNAVIMFFSELMPKHILLALEIGVIALPLLFHGIYGLFITQRGKNNVLMPKYRHPENLMYTSQRISGIVLFLLLIGHVYQTTYQAKFSKLGEEAIQYKAWNELLTGNSYIFLILYMIGVALAAYHLSFGIWNFCIRWGVVVSEKSQVVLRKVSGVMWFAITALGWLALVGFVNANYDATKIKETTQVSSTHAGQPGVMPK